MISDKILTLVFVAALFMFFALSLKIKNLQLQRDSALTQVNYLSSQIEIQNTAVKDLQEKSASYQRKYDEMQKEARMVYAENSKSTEKIMNAMVPKDCIEAMRWGVRESMVLE